MQPSKGIQDKKYLIAQNRPTFKRKRRTAIMIPGHRASSAVPAALPALQHMVLALLPDICYCLARASVAFPTIFRQSRAVRAAEPCYAGLQASGAALPRGPQGAPRWSCSAGWQDGACCLLAAPPQSPMWSTCRMETRCRCLAALQAVGASCSGSGCSPSLTGRCRRCSTTTPSTLSRWEASWHEEAEETTSLPVISSSIPIELSPAIPLPLCPGWGGKAGAGAARRGAFHLAAACGGR